MNEKARIVFLISGNGGNLRFLHNLTVQMELPFIIVGVIADRECKALEYAEQVGITNFKISYTRDNPEELRLRLSFFFPNIIITNIHKIIDVETLNLFKDKFINLHYSLLPAFAGEIGMSTVDKAKLKNIQFIGTSTHYLTEEVDAGAIISQSVFKVDWTMEKEKIYDIVFKSGFINLISSIFIHLGFKPSEQKIKIINEIEVNFSPNLCLHNITFRI